MSQQKLSHAMLCTLRETVGVESKFSRVYMELNRCLTISIGHNMILYWYYVLLSFSLKNFTIEIRKSDVELINKMSFCLNIIYKTIFFNNFPI